MRILAIRSGGLGDTIVTLPALSALSARASAVELVGTAPYIELARRAALAAEVHAIDRAMFRAFFASEAEEGELVTFLRRFDLVVAWSRLPLASQKLARLGIDLLEAPPLPPDGVHASDHLVGALEPLGIHGPAKPPVIPAPEPPPSLLDGLGVAAESYVALHPSSGSPAKNWPEARFAELAALVRREGLEPVWIRGEADHGVVERLVAQVPAPVASELSLDTLASLLLGARAYVGNDSGVSHMAAAVGAPTVAVFRSTDPAQWAPRGRRVRVARSGASPEQVWGFARDLMAKR